MAGILEAFLAGKEARRVADAAEQINAMNAFLGQNGAALMNGDQNAMAQLAGFGPQGLQMAMGMKGDMQAQERQAQMDAIAAEERAYGRERDKVRDSREDQKWEMQMAEYKASLTAEQAAAEAAQLEDAAKMALTATSPEQWDQLAQENGAPELVGQFENREAVAARFMSMAEVLKSQEAPEPADEYGRYVAEETARGNQPLDRIGFENAKKGNGVTQTIRNPDGSETVIQVGGPAGGDGSGRTTKPTEGNLASEGYLGRMKGAEKVFDELEKAGTTAIGITDTLAVGTRAEPYKLTVPEQKLIQAQRDWVRAKLRKESGAVIGEEEMAAEIMTYFPQPGEGPEIIKQKKESRRMAEEQLRITAALPAAGSGSPPPAEAPVGSSSFEDAWSKY